MRIAIAAIVAAGLASSPVAAQETNQANAAAPAPVATEPDTANAVGEPVLPVTDNVVDVDPMAPVADPTLDADVRPARSENRGFPWGLLGLIGLVGLLGRARR